MMGNGLSRAVVTIQTIHRFKSYMPEPSSILKMAPKWGIRILETNVCNLLRPIKNVLAPPHPTLNTYSPLQYRIHILENSRSHFGWPRTEILRLLGTWGFQRSIRGVSDVRNKNSHQKKGLPMLPWT